MLAKRISFRFEVEIFLKQILRTLPLTSYRTVTF